MKAAAIVTSLAVLAQATNFQKRQDLFGLSIQSGPPKEPISIRKIKATIDDAAIREQILYGPFIVKSANSTHTAPKGALQLDKNSDILNARLAGLCKNCNILEAQADLAKKDGSKADIGSGVYSHHIIITDIGRSMVRPPVKAICPDGSIGGFNFGVGGMMGGSKDSSMSHSGHSRRQLPSGLAGLAGLLPQFSVFIGQGDEGSPMTFQLPKSKVKSGFYAGTKDQFNMMAEVINYEKTDQEIYIMLNYEYVPMPEKPADLHDVGMGAINVSPCKGETLNLHPPTDKAVKYDSPPWSVSADGYLINVKPHLHDGGINMTFYVNSKPACTSKAVYGGTDGGLAVGGQKWETITAYQPCEEAIAIKKGDNLTMSAWYDLREHRLRPQSNDHSAEAEGMALATFLYAKPPS